MLVQWNMFLSVGVDALDKQHKRLVDLLNRLHDSMLAGKGRDIVENIMNELLDYAEEHFQFEEKFFSSRGYSGLESHKKQHRAFRDKILDLKNKKQEGYFLVTPELLEFLEDWLVSHIKTSDKKAVQEVLKKENP